MVKWFCGAGGSALLIGVVRTSGHSGQLNCEVGCRVLQVFGNFCFKIETVLQYLLKDVALEQLRQSLVADLNVIASGTSRSLGSTGTST
jgi:hypothetical protein